jgi:hypothetical protein
VKGHFTNTIYLIILLCLTACSPESTVPPVLVLSSGNEFGSYTAEILKTEGFNEFMMDSISGNQITKSYLARFDLIILAEPEIEKRISPLSEIMLRTEES